VLFVGYQAQGTPGRQILEHSRGDHPYVVLDNERIPIRATIHQLSGYSAHAGRDDLLAFVRKMRQPPSEIRIVHGEDSAKQSLTHALRTMLPHTKVWIP
jgi:metallo-beta-lactamase family protein